MSDFTYQFFDTNILIIYDADLGNRSVTNDMENVLATISKIENIELKGYRIAYQDSMGVFDGVSYKNGSYQIYSLNKQNEVDVINHFRNQ